MEAYIIDNRVKYASFIINKAIKKWIYKKKVQKSKMCEAFTHHMCNQLHTLISLKDIDRSLYIGGSILYGPDITHNKHNMYFSLFQIENKDFLMTNRFTTHVPGSTKCRLYGYGIQGSACDNCIGWCGAIGPKKCKMFVKRESIMLIIRTIKRWIRRRLNDKKYHHIIYFHKGLVAHFENNAIATPPFPIRNKVMTLYNKRFCRHIASFLLRDKYIQKKL